MTLGGLKQGVTPLDMAHAYQTFARGGKLVYGRMSPGALRSGGPVPGPVGIRPIARRDDGKKLKPVRLPNGGPARNRSATKRVLDEGVAEQRRQPCCRAWSRAAPARARSSANVIVAGKTGTTENYGDAWFVG